MSGDEARYGTFEQKQTLVRRALWYFGVSIVLMAISFAIPRLTGTYPLAGYATLLLFVHFALWIFGCGFYAGSKGYSFLLGIAGTLCFVGVGIVALLPDRWKMFLERPTTRTGPSDLTNYPR